MIQLSRKKNSTFTLLKRENEERLEKNNNNNNNSYNNVSNDLEINWFMKEEFPKVCASLRETLKELLNFIMKSSKEGHNEDIDNMYDDSRITFKSNNEMLSGSLALDGWNIVEADMNIKFNQSGRNNVKVSVQSSNPWKLEQIQSIYYYCCEALEQFEDILSTYPPEEIDLVVTNRILDLVMQKLRLAKDQLLKPNNVSFESNLQNRKIFKPSLPNDLIVDFKIKNQVIQITTAVLQISSLNKSTGTVKSPTLSKSSTKIHKKSSGKSFRRQNQHYEILEQNTVECKPKKLESLCTLLHNAYSIALSCKEKNSVLLSLNIF